MVFENNTVTKNNFINNIEEKMALPLFVNDMNVLIAPAIQYDTYISMQLVIGKIINKI